MTVSPIPPGCNSVNAYLIMKDTKKAMDFYCIAFGGQVTACLEAPNGSVMHGEVKIGNSTIMLSQENPDWQMLSAETLGASPASLHFYTDDCDAVFHHAIEAGCIEISPLMDAFWGDRYGKVQDPFGYQWGIATHKEELTMEELQRRGEDWFRQIGMAVE